MMGKINIDKSGRFDPIKVERQPEVKPGSDTPIKVEGGNVKVGRDEVKVSEKASEFSKLVSQVKEMPDVRADRVGDVKARIESGSLNPSAEEIVDAILNDEKK